MGPIGDIDYVHSHKSRTGGVINGEDDIYLPVKGHSLNVSDLPPSLGGIGYSAPFEVINTSSSNISDCLDSFLSKTIDNSFGIINGGKTIQNNNGSSLINDDSTLLMKLLSSTTSSLSNNRNSQMSCLNNIITNPSLWDTSTTSTSTTTTPLTIPLTIPGFIKSDTFNSIGGGGGTYQPQLSNHQLPDNNTNFSTTPFDYNPSFNNNISVFTPTVGHHHQQQQRQEEGRRRSSSSNDNQMILNNNIGVGRIASGRNIENDDCNGPVRVVRRAHGWVTTLRSGGRQATGPYRQTIQQCIEDQREIHRLKNEKNINKQEVMRLLEKMKNLVDQNSCIRKKPKKVDYVAPVGVRRMHKGFRASVRVSGREVYGPLRHDVADASCDRQEMMKYRHAMDTNEMRAFAKSLKNRIYPHHMQQQQSQATAKIQSLSLSINNLDTDSILTPLSAEDSGVDSTLCLKDKSECQQHSILLSLIPSLQ